MLIPSGKRKVLQMGIQELTQYFTQYGAIFVFVIVLLEYMNLPAPGRHHYAYGRRMGIKGPDRILDGDGIIGCGRASGQLDIIFPWTAWRRCILPVLYKEISKAEGTVGEEHGSAAAQGFDWRVYQQASSTGQNIDFHSGRDDFYEFHQVYHQFPDGSGAVESDIYRGRIFPGSIPSGSLLA